MWLCHHLNGCQPESSPPLLCWDLDSVTALFQGHTDSSCCGGEGVETKLSPFLLLSALPGAWPLSVNAKFDLVRIWLHILWPSLPAWWCCRQEEHLLPTCETKSPGPSASPVSLNQKLFSAEHATATLCFCHGLALHDTTTMECRLDCITYAVV